MSLTAGTRLGPYEIVEPIGKGGMGEVYRARDTKLDRDVAIKVLPDELAADEERVARFEREAKLLASLNHPNIAGIYGFEESGDVKALVLELVEGATLAERIALSPIPVEEAIAIAKQIAEAVEAGHESGVIHRDLKPANVKLTEDGTVKVLDYGLAKALDVSAPAAADADRSQSPTWTRQGTGIGVILGTAAYMSPEQAKGKRVDKRADIFAFGAILFEMLTGRPLFDGETATDTLAAVLRAEIDFSQLPDATPPAVRHLLARCLDRDARTRLRDLGEARILLQETELPYPPSDRKEEATERRWTRYGLVALSSLLVGVAAGRLLSGPDVVSPTGFAFEVTADEGQIAGEMAISPDGRRIVFSVGTEEGASQLWLRRLDRLGSRPLAGTEGASHPFWSPDSREIAYFAEAQLWRLPLDGAPSRRVAPAPDALGGSWSREGVILFGTDGGPLFRVEATGGQAPEGVTPFDANAENAHAWPVFLPDGRRFVFLTDASDDEGHVVRLGSLDGGPLEILLTTVRSSLAVDPRGALLLTRGNVLVSHPFDLASGRLTGESMQVANGVFALGGRHHAPFSISSDGVLAYQRGSSLADLVLLSPTGEHIGQIASSQHVGNPEFSPDGQFITYGTEPSSEEWLIWSYDLARGVPTLISRRGEQASDPSWSSDGRVVYFGRHEGGDASSLDRPARIFTMAADGSGPMTALDSPPGAVRSFVLDSSPDGHWLLALAEKERENYDIFLGSLARSPIGWTPWMDTPASETYAQFAPDSRWVAFVSDVSGREEVYVAALDREATGGRWQVSANGGREPRFAPDGARIYYKSFQGWLMSARVQLRDDGIEVGPPETHFDLMTPVELGYLRNTFDIAPDGESLAVVRTSGTGAAPIRIVTGWQPFEAIE